MFNAFHCRSILTIWSTRVFLLKSRQLLQVRYSMQQLRAQLQSSTWWIEVWCLEGSSQSLSMPRIVEEFWALKTQVGASLGSNKACLLRTLSKLQQTQPSQPVKLAAIWLANSRQVPSNANFQWSSAKPNWPQLRARKSYRKVAVSIRLIVATMPKQINSQGLKLTKLNRRRMGQK